MCLSNLTSSSPRDRAVEVCVPPPRPTAKLSSEIPSFGPPEEGTRHIGADATGWLDNANEMLGIVDHLTNGGFLGQLGVGDLITDLMVERWRRGLIDGHALDRRRGRHWGPSQSGTQRDCILCGMEERGLGVLLWRHIGRVDSWFTTTPGFRQSGQWRWIGLWFARHSNG